MTTDNFVFLVFISLLGLGIYRLFFYKPSASVKVVRELIASAKSLDKEVKDAKANSDAAVIEFERRLREYRAKGERTGPKL